MSFEPVSTLAPRTLIERALVYAARVHAGQRRGETGIPYVSHLLATCAIVAEAGGDEEEMAAALLHDAAEDHGGAARLEEIRRLFGDRVAEIVAGCTDALEEQPPEWRERKERYVRHLNTAPESVVLVSSADKLHNARSIVRDLRDEGSGFWERFRRADEVWWYYSSLAAAYERRGAKLAATLSAVVDELGAEIERNPDPRLQ